MIGTRKAVPVMVAGLLLWHAQGGSQGRRQHTADQQAFQAAMALADPAQRLTALRTFSVEYQDSKYFDSVQEAALQLLLRYYPTRVADIRDQVQVNVANASKGYERWREQSTEADSLAEAGMLLPLAQRLAEDAVHNLTEAAYLRGMAHFYGELRAEMPTAEELHGGYAEVRATALLSLAHVYLRQEKPTLAAPLVEQAATLQPRSASLHVLQAQLAVRAGDNERALADLERAAVLGDLLDSDRQTMVRLYQAAHPENPSGLQAALDSRWNELNPPPFTPAPRPAAGGHTALLELFTGAGCLPCAGAEIAAESLLASSPAGDVVLLEWDEHVPVPDALTSPAGVERAEVLDASSIPTFFLDGKRMPVFGGTREGAKDVYAQLVRLVDIQAARPTAVTLHLTVQRDAAGALHALATTNSQPPERSTATLAEENAPWPGDSITVAARAHDEAAQAPALVLNFALVEDDVRYSGGNGMRFHRMVVRATSSAPAWGEPLHTGNTDQFRASFDPAEVRQTLSSYLQHFQADNDRFGPIKLRSTDVSLQPDKLGVVAFVQDTQTHRVVQAAFARPTIAAEPQGVSATVAVPTDSIEGLKQR